MYCYERTLLRARFDRYKNEKDFTKATQLLRLGEEEFWENQAPAPSVFPNEPDGVTFQRFWTNQVPIDNFSEIEQMLLSKTVISIILFQCNEMLLYTFCFLEVLY